MPAKKAPVQIPVVDSSENPNSFAAKRQRISDEKKARKLLNEVRQLSVERRLLAKAKQELLRRTLATIGASASKFAASPTMFAVFCADEFWTENPMQAPKASDRARALKFLIRWHCGPGKAASKRASEYWRALRDMELGPDMHEWLRAFKARGGVFGRKKSPGQRKAVPSTTVLPPPWGDDTEVAHVPARHSATPILADEWVFARIQLKPAVLCELLRLPSSVDLEIGGAELVRISGSPVLRFQTVTRKA